MNKGFESCNISSVSSHRFDGNKIFELVTNTATFRTQKYVNHICRTNKSWAVCVAYNDYNEQNPELR